MPYLIDIQQIRPSVPTPIPHHRAKLACSKLNYLAGAILGEQTDHGARTWPAVQPYRQLLGGLSRAEEPKEGVGRVCTGNVDPSCVLLLPSTTFPAELKTNKS